MGVRGERAPESCDRPPDQVWGRLTRIPGKTIVRRPREYSAFLTPLPPSRSLLERAYS